jgi:hypothetical protein
MGRLGKNHIRFPHRCEIYSIGEVTPFSEGEKVTLWKGRCRKESNTSVRTFYGQDHVFKSDYRVQLGSLVGGKLDGDVDFAHDGKEGDECGAVVKGIKSGMFIDVTDLSGTTVGMRVSDSYAGDLGTTVYCDNPKN